MTLNIKSDRADRLASELSALTGDSITDVVVESLEARLAIERSRRRKRSLDDLGERFRLLPVLDGRSPEEVIGSDINGLPE